MDLTSLCGAAKDQDARFQQYCNMSARGGIFAALVCTTPVSIETESICNASQQQSLHTLGSCSTELPVCICINAISVFYIPDKEQTNNGSRLPSYNLALQSR